jgi:hypothetical protein
MRRSLVLAALLALAACDAGNIRHPGAENLLQYPPVTIVHPAPGRTVAPGAERATVYVMFHASSMAPLDVIHFSLDGKSLGTVPDATEPVVLEGVAAGTHVLHATVTDGRLAPRDGRGAFPWTHAVRLFHVGEADEAYHWVTPDGDHVAFDPERDPWLEGTVSGARGRIHVNPLVHNCAPGTTCRVRVSVDGKETAVLETYTARMAGAIGSVEKAHSLDVPAGEHTVLLELVHPASAPSQDVFEDGVDEEEPPAAWVPATGRPFTQVEFRVRVS